MIVIISRTSWLLVCAIALFGCATKATVPLYIDARSGHFFVDAVFGGTEGAFLIDTGASMPVVSKRFLETQPSLNSEIRTEQVPIDSVDTPPQLAIDQGGEILLASPPSFSIGPVFYGSRGQFIVADLSVIQAFVDTNIDGIVSSAILNVAPYSIDFPNRELTVGRLHQMSTSERISFERQYPYVRVVLNGHPFRFMIDTGALHSSIEVDVIKELGASIAVTDARDRMSVSVDGVIRKDIRRTEIDRVEFGGNQMRSISVIVDEENVIGLDILRAGVLSINPHKGEFAFLLGGVPDN